MTQDWEMAVIVSLVAFYISGIFGGTGKPKIDYALRIFLALWVGILFYRLC